MAASNAMHGEAAAAISIELGMRGPYQVIATGCSAGIDALGVAAMHMQVGLAERALVVAVDLPLVPPLLEIYAQTGILARSHRNDPYHPLSRGIAPAEAAAALTLERAKSASAPRLLGYLANSDAMDALTLAPASGQLAQLLLQGIRNWGWPQALCPHATGTAAHAKFEPQILREVFANEPWPSLHLLKPYLGHGIGAGSLLETVLLCAFLQQSRLPPNLAALTAPEPFAVPAQESPACGPIFKIAASLGGHNAIVGLMAGN
jgi:3-oxoacyl-[acyl-carrier-protein] synthase II